MNNYCCLIVIVLLFITSLSAQERVNPVVAEYGGIYPIENAIIKADTALNYRVVIDVFSSSVSPDRVNPAFNNVARLLNLYGVDGVRGAHVVLAIHAGATYSILTHKAYKEKYEVDNPNIALLTALKNAGVTLAVCGQSLIGRKVAKEDVVSEVDIATSMLSIVTMYQLKGYAFLRF